MTSRDVVNRVLGVLRDRSAKPTKLPKAGHAGTLDPMASGVLVVGIGAGVRLVPYLHQQSKVYEATFRLGQSSASGDLETPLTDHPDPPQPEFSALQAAAQRLTGQITQIPPAHSAIKVAGRKAYRYAHQGIQIEVPSRVVRVDAIQIRRYEYPEIELMIRCGTGTYIRTLGIDLAGLCETTAVMTKLVRTSIGDFTLGDAVTLDQLSGENVERYLQPIARATGHLPQLQLSDQQIELLANGIKLSADNIAASPPTDINEAAVLDSQGALRVIVHRRTHQWCPYRVFPKAVK